MSPSPSELSALKWAHPLVREWFVNKFSTPTEPQEQGWPQILARRNTLICAPTGSGKTLAAFLACIDGLVRKAIAGDLLDQTEVLYVSPLKALSNDIQKNLDAPLGEILQLARERGYLVPEIRTAVRTGDTLMHERRKMLDRPPHILVTTPESLYILLTAAKSREILRTVTTLIVDEIHAVADDKRGAHLSLSLERLEAITPQPPVRIGLSATQKPIELVGQFLVGSERPAPVIVEVAQRRQIDLAVEVPSSELGPVASNEMWDEIYARIAKLVQDHRSTLIFVNTRRLAERVAHNLAPLLGEDAVASHHGSLSRQRRLAVEAKLKAGEIRALVATASLELGIDIGTVDLVCQIGSPRSIAVALQRAGRSGHWRGAVPKCRFFATTRDELIECGALVRSMRRGELDRLQIPEAPLDVLAQQIVAACAADDWQEDDLYALVRRAFQYRNLPRNDFDEIVAMLSDGIAARRGRYGAYLHRDQVNHRLRGRRGARLAAITSGGAIPDNALYTVIAEPEGVVIGTVDEDFAVESLRGDIILLGNTSWRIRRVQAGSVLVEDAKGAPPNVPFWLGEAPSRTTELSQQVAEIRERVNELTAAAKPRSERTAGVPAGILRPPNEQTPSLSAEDNLDSSPLPINLQSTIQSPQQSAAAIDWLRDECGMDQSGAEQTVEYILAGRAVLRAVPTQQTIIAERFFDEAGGMQLIIHAPFGGRINKAWGLALRKRFCRSFNFELQAAATENGINISLGEQHSFPLADVFHFLHSESVEELLEQAVLASPIFGTRWRWAAGRSLALLRFMGGKKVPPQIQRMRSDDLLAAVFPEAAACQENIEGDIKIPDHPLTRETMKDSLREAMDIDGLKQVLADIGGGKINCLAVETPVPSQFSHEILNANPYAYLDDAPLEERRARAVEMRRALPESVLSEIGRLDPAAIAEVCAEVWPDVRDAHELHDALLDLIALPESSDSLQRSTASGSTRAWSDYFSALVAARRAERARARGRIYWVTAEKAATFVAIFPDAVFDSPLPAIEQAQPSREDALLLFLTGWFAHSGPTTAKALGEQLGVAASDVEKTILRLEASGAILRGTFTGESRDEIEWCNRRVLARIHKLTLGALRKQIEPVNAAQFMRWLLRWQHVAPNSRLLGEHGTLEILQQLQGFEAPANSWESQILARRIANYDPKVLDNLCLTGSVGWGRLSPHPSTLGESSDAIRRVIPTSVAPLTFFIREDAEWMIPRHAEGDAKESSALSPAAREVLTHLRQRGASFFADIVRATGKLKAEIETALWELVTAGMITADGFDNIRALIDPKRRAGQGRGHSSRPRHSVGRWSLLYASEAPDRTRVAEATCWMLLRRYGVVFREMIARETILPRWRELLIAFRRLEDQGQIRGGRFVSGFLGEQFALPVAVESLRAGDRQPVAQESVTLAAADPLNLVGIIIPGERVSSASGKTITLRDGVLAETEESVRRYA
ncbi:MAG: DEAD/DEAH box helicase [Candidatus Acidiferrales bacterium]